MKEYKMIPRNRIMREEKCQLRDVYDEETKESLRESMKRYGWLPEHPAIVNLAGLLLDGHHRLDIASELKIRDIPSIEVDARTEVQVLEKQLIGILLKKDLEPIEKAKAIERYVAKRLNIELKKVGEHAHQNKKELIEALKPIGVSAGRYYQLMRVLGKEDVKEAIEEGDISFRKGEEIAKVQEPEEREELIERTKTEDLKVSELREEVKEINDPSKPEVLSEGDLPPEEEETEPDEFEKTEIETEKKEKTDKELEKLLKKRVKTAPSNRQFKLTLNNVITELRGLEKFDSNRFSQNLVEELDNRINAGIKILENIRTNIHNNIK